MRIVAIELANFAFWLICVNQKYVVVDMIIMQSIDLTIKVVFASRKLMFVQRLIVMNWTTKNTD